MTIVTIYNNNGPRTLAEFYSWRDKVYKKEAHEATADGYHLHLNFDYSTDLSQFKMFMKRQPMNAVIVTDGNGLVGDIPEGLNVVMMYNMAIWSNAHERIFADLSAHKAVLVIAGSVPGQFVKAKGNYDKDTRNPFIETYVLIDGELR